MILFIALAIENVQYERNVNVLAGRACFQHLLSLATLDPTSSESKERAI